LSLSIVAAMAAGRERQPAAFGYHHAMKINTPEQYRAAVAEVQKLEHVREGSPEFNRRQELMTATHDYELDHLTDPECRRGRPPGSI
jgi:hypothetical protein